MGTHTLKRGSHTDSFAVIFEILSLSTHEKGETLVWKVTKEPIINHEYHVTKDYRKTRLLMTPIPKVKRVDKQES